MALPVKILQTHKIVNIGIRGLLTAKNSRNKMLPRWALNLDLSHALLSELLIHVLLGIFSYCLLFLHHFNHWIIWLEPIDHDHNQIFELQVKHIPVTQRREIQINSFCCWIFLFSRSIACDPNIEIWEFWLICDEHAWDGVLILHWISLKIWTKTATRKAALFLNMIVACKYVELKSEIMEEWSGFFLDE